MPEERNRFRMDDNPLQLMTGVQDAHVYIKHLLELGMDYIRDNYLSTEQGGAEAARETTFLGILFREHTLGTAKYLDEAIELFVRRGPDHSKKINIYFDADKETIPSRPYVIVGKSEEERDVQNNASVDSAGDYRIGTNTANNTPVNVTLRTPPMLTTISFAYIANSQMTVNIMRKVFQCIIIGGGGLRIIRGGTMSNYFTNLGYRETGASLIRQGDQDKGKELYKAMATATYQFRAVVPEIFSFSTSVPRTFVVDCETLF